MNFVLFLFFQLLCIGMLTFVARKFQAKQSSCDANISVLVYVNSLLHVVIATVFSRLIAAEKAEDRNVTLNLRNCFALLAKHLIKAKLK